MAESLKYSFEEAQQWSLKKNEPRTEGKSVLYIFGALSFLLLFVAVLSIFMNQEPTTPPPASNPALPPAADDSESTTSESSQSESESASSITEHDVLEDIKKSKRTVKAQS
jgi:cytoskeletal protein RodZ